MKTPLEETGHAEQQQQQPAAAAAAMSSSIRIRLQRFGQIHRPFYRIVACSRYAPRDGKFMEILGTYNPIPDSHGNKQVTLKVDKIKKWIMNGAEPSERVAKLLGAAEVLPPTPRRYLPKLALEPAAAAATPVEDEVDADEGPASSAEDASSSEAAEDAK